MFSPTATLRATVSTNCRRWGKHAFFWTRRGAQLEKKLRREIASKLRPKLVLHYNSGNRDDAAAANAITALIGA
jgi:hypothetical protein